MNGMDLKTTDETAIDQVALAAAGGGNRRTVLRGVAATLLATAGGGIAASTQARKKGGKKGRKKKKGQQTPPGQNPTPGQHPPQTCTPGEFIARVSVPANGSTVNTPVLLENVDYVLKPSGFWGTGTNVLQDAFASFTFADPFSPRLFTDGVRTGLLLDGELPDIWGSYKPNHSYGIVVIGKGKSIGFRMLDNDYTGNSGVVHVDVTCAVQRQD